MTKKSKCPQIILIDGDSIAYMAAATEDMDEANLNKALAEIGKLESYAYEEFRHEQIDLSEFVFTLARWLMLFWILLIATICHPARFVALSGRN